MTEDHDVKSSGTWNRFKPTDLAGLLSCEHLVSLERLVHTGQLERTFRSDPMLDLLRIRGTAHERAHLERLKAGGLEVVEIAADADVRDSTFWATGVAASIEAMRRGVDAIYQAPLSAGGYSGIVDFLMRVDRPSELGVWSYEVLDTKLSALTKATTVLQLCLYSELVAQVQGAVPESALVLPGGAVVPERYRLADFGAYYEYIRKAFEIAARQEASESYPEPVDHCEICQWWRRCSDRRRADDHLSLVSRITRRQRRLLVQQGVGTSFALSQLPIGQELPAVSGIARISLTRLREQARIQIEGRGLETPKYELLETQPKLGLAALPMPSPGDVFLDLEGDHYAAHGGLEYLFGVVTLGPNGSLEYDCRWAHDAASEKRAFEWLVDFLDGRDLDHPGFRVYHYGAYEESAMKRLMYRHGVKDRQVDDFLRRELFVDLNRIVQQTLRASVESYSLKNIEKITGFTREISPEKATFARKKFALSLEIDEPDDQRAETEKTIEAYNREDCIALLRVREFLEAVRGELCSQGKQLARPVPPDVELKKDLLDYLSNAARLRGALLAGFPADEAEASPDQLSKRLLAHLLEFHRREDNASSWQYYGWLRMGEQELLDERGPIAQLGPPESKLKVGRGSEVFRYAFPSQEHTMTVDTEVTDPSTRESSGYVYAVNDSEGWIELKRTPKQSKQAHPRAIVPREDSVRTWDLRNSLLRTAEEIAKNGMLASGGRSLVGKLLLRETVPVAAASPYLPAQIAGGIFPVQGPPGTGKTYIGARLILEAVARGLRVGLCAHSHRAICNILNELFEAGVPGAAVVAQAADGDNFCQIDRVRQFPKNGDMEKALATERFDLVAGTAWLWSKESVQASPVDILFVDEAGQMSMANAVAISPAAQALVFLGDPQQLSHPQRLEHPSGAGGSVLEHLLAGKPTIQAERGLFLDRTYRLNSALCAFTSNSFYEGRLKATPSAELQRLNVSGALDGTGLRFLPVTHVANSSKSIEEVELVDRLVRRLLGAGATWTNANGAVENLRLEHILVVAPYNAQVQALLQRLPIGARVGTVDKFQGQQAPVVIYSMTTSSIDDAPRGMDFILSANRFNVAISRARCVAVLVANPELIKPKCRTPAQMRLSNAFCRFLEGAVPLDPASA